MPRKKKATAPKKTRRRRAKKSTALAPRKRRAAPRVRRKKRTSVVRTAASMIAPIKRRKSKGRSRGGVGNGSTKTMLVDGIVIVGSAAAAIKANQMIAQRPFGLKPATIALIATAGIGIVFRKKNKKIAHYAFKSSLGIATGIATEAALASGGGGGPTV